MLMAATRGGGRGRRPTNIDNECKYAEEQCHVAALTNNLRDIMRASADLVGPQLDIRLHNSVLELAANESLGVKHGVCGDDCINSTQVGTTHGHGLRQVGLIPHLASDATQTLCLNLDYTCHSVSRVPDATDRRPTNTSDSRRINDVFQPWDESCLSQAEGLGLGASIGRAVHDASV
eukprot:365942-Chlamydomonas_euryale.AAC.54